MERGPSALDEFFVRATAKRRPRVCFIPTGSGDSEEFLSKFYATFSKLDCRPNHLAFFRKLRRNAIPLDKLEQGLLAQDAIYVGGGNTRSMLAVWREWGLDRILRKAWRRGILLGGISAGAICWFQAGASDSVPGPGRSTPCGVLAFSEEVVFPISMVSLTEGVTFPTLSPAGSCLMESRSTMELPCSFKTNPSLRW